MNECTLPKQTAKRTNFVTGIKWTLSKKQKLTNFHSEIYWVVPWHLETFRKRGNKKKPDFWRLFIINLLDKFLICGITSCITDIELNEILRHNIFQSCLLCDRHKHTSQITNVTRVSVKMWRKNKFSLGPPIILLFIHELSETKR